MQSAAPASPGPLSLRTLLSALLFILPMIPSVARAQADADDAAQELATVFDDFLHFARIGKFTEANAYAEQILSHPDISPANLLAAADRDKESIATLITLIQHTSVADNAQALLDLIRKGEYERRQDPARIRDNIEKLGGTPQMEFNAIQRLKESGEYAVPQMIEALLDPSREQIWARIIRALPQIGHPAVGPLVMALGISDAHVRQSALWVLGELGYPQATPYLLKVIYDPGAREETRQAALAALERIENISDRNPPPSAVLAFLSLAEQYYSEHGSVRADPRLSTANVWYLEDGELVRIAVPTEIFGAIMSMRCCEEALVIEPNSRNAISLWLAGNIRREARLGMDVESGEPDAGADADATRKEGFPRSIYFSRAAGPEYCHLVLGRAVQDVDKPVALGAIAALDAVAGESSLIGSEEYKQPLVRALRFPDPEVRFKAAIALARALPKKPFAGMEVVGEVLADAVRQRGAAQYVVAVGDPTELNRTASKLREPGAQVVAETNFLAAMQRARRELANVTAFFIATDVESPTLASAVGDLRGEFQFARTPIMALIQPKQEHRAELALQYPLVGEVDIAASGDEMLAALDDVVAHGDGASLSEDLAIELALRATEVLRMVAIDGRTVIDTSPTVPALLTALESPEQQLQINAARVLSLIPLAQAQQAIATLALTESNAAELRLAAFDALAESARRFGNRLTSEQVSGVVQTAADVADLTMSTTATKALGALNLQVNEASEIIRSYHRG